MNGTSINLTREQLGRLEDYMRERGEYFQINDDGMRFPYNGHEVYISFYPTNGEYPISIHDVGDVLDMFTIRDELEIIAKEGNKWE